MLMKFPTIVGSMRRRILVNYRVDPDVIQRLLPARFRPKLHAGRAVAGICLIRLEHIRPKMLPEIVGINSENTAHRIAVLWDDDSGNIREGVFIPRRDTDSTLNHLLGGRVFPGEHHKAAFRIAESEVDIDITMQSRDAQVTVMVAGRVADSLPPSSIFESVSASSAFFESGRLGYSVTSNPCRLDGLVLETDEWRVQPLEITKVQSSYFAENSMFPQGSAEFDHALIMRNVVHEWHAAPDLFV
jgi:hypothetical protein